MLIYEPQGKAREYSPLAINLYTGCGHRCSYCYVPKTLRLDRKIFDNEVNPKTSVIQTLKKEIPKFRNSDKQIFMSFTTDPYNPLDRELQLTRKALELFLLYRIPISILTKSGLVSLRDMDIFKKFGEHIKIGASLTYDNNYDSDRIEAGAAMPEERLLMLKMLHDNGIKTWVSFEPIMHGKQVVNLLNQCIDYVDEFQFGKLDVEKRPIDWNSFLQPIVDLLRSKNKEFYIKETLRAAADKVILNPHEKEMDYLTLKPFDKGLFKN